MEERPNYTSQPEENVIGELWAKYAPYWPVYLLLVLMAISGTWFYLHYKLPLYESTATLLIKDERKGIEDSKMVESLNLFESKKTLENEIEVIKSRDLMSQVVDQLKLYAPVFEKTKRRVRSAYVTSPVKIEVQNPDSLVEVSKVDFNYDAAGKRVYLGGRWFILDQWLNTAWGKLKFTQNNTGYNNNSTQLYFSLVSPKRIIKNLIGRLDASATNKLASVVNLKIIDEVPKRSEDILAALITAYDKAEITDRNVLAENTLSFLDDRLKIVSGDLNTIEKQMQQYKARNGAIDISSQGKLFLQNVSDNDQKLSTVNMKLTVLNQVEQNIFSSNSHDELIPTTLGLEEPILTNLINKLYELELQYEKLISTTGESNSQALSVADQIKKVKANILENIRSQRKSLEVNKASLSSTNGNYNSLLQALPQQERDLVEISRQQNIKSSIYSYLLQKREETALSHSSTVSNTKVVDKAEYSLDPVGLPSIILYAIAIIIALILGISIVAIRELMNHTILFRKEIEKATPFPVIAEIIYEKSKSPLVLQQGKTTFIAEQFRMLRVSINQLGIGTKGKKLMITSTISGEGKSFVTANLGLSLSMAGKRVVIVEFDLSNPTLAHKFNMEGQMGVADYLAEKTTVENIIKKTDVNPNLFLISAGNLPSDPSDLIMSDRSAMLLQYLDKMFDYVLVDTAPVGLLSDGYNLSKFCDATLYIVRHHNTPKKMLERLGPNNKVNELKNLAIVFNGVRSRGFGINKYGYGYGYGYLYNKSK